LGRVSREIAHPPARVAAAAAPMIVARRVIRPPGGPFRHRARIRRRSVAIAGAQDHVDELPRARAGLGAGSREIQTRTRREQHALPRCRTNLDLDRHPGTHPLRVGSVESDANVVGAPKRAPGFFLRHGRDLRDLPRIRPLGVGIEHAAHREADGDPPVVDVGELGLDLHLTEVGKADDGNPHPHRISELKLAPLPGMIGHDEDAVAGALRTMPSIA
jgi:hypothetical protein